MAEIGLSASASVPSTNRARTRRLLIGAIIIAPVISGAAFWSSGGERDKEPTGQVTVVEGPSVQAKQPVGQATPHGGLPAQQSLGGFDVVQRQLFSRSQPRQAEAEKLLRQNIVAQRLEIASRSIQLTDVIVTTDIVELQWTIAIHGAGDQDAVVEAIKKSQIADGLRRVGLTDLTPASINKADDSHLVFVIHGRPGS